MVRYRRRFEIIADIVNVAGKGAKKTRIMYIANLSYKLLEKYLGEALKVGLIHVDSDGYKATEKGQIFLERFGQFSSKYSKIEKDVEALKYEIDVLERMCASEEKAANSFGNGRRKLDELVL